jgi:hypothetical protein
VPAGDHQDVGRALRVDVVEGQELLVLVGHLGGHPPRHDLAEEAGHGPSLQACQFPVQRRQQLADVARVLAEIELPDA